MPEGRQDDEIYLELLENRDKGSESLLRRYAPRWWAFLQKKYTPKLQREDFEEIISTTVWKICQALDSFDENRASLWTWAFAIMNNTAIEYLRKAQKGIKFTKLEPEKWKSIPAPENEYDDAPHQPVFSSEVLEAFNEAFTALPTDQQNVYRIFAEHDEIRASEVGEILGLSTGNVRQLKKRAFDKLKSALNDTRQTENQ
ncbi:MAG: sigma-70 family RNA polymerase sigma factor [Planctomycetota bacterium]